MFLILFNAQFGFVNKAIQWITNNPDFVKNWFFEKNTAFFVVSLIWIPYAATITILIMAEIAAIDEGLLEAARVDGATELQINLRIILPLLRNIIGTCVILGGTSMLQKLDVLMITTGGGPLNATLNLPMFIYKTALTENNFGLANTAGVFLIGIGLILVLGVNKLFKLGRSDV
ncbi:MAG: sugar ABC transporter permease, partial [Acetivibrio sp.]